ncbi:MAG: peptide chain release factor 1 [Anaerolineaceae bacterium]|nr:peptide chain release factor 1 [Anaerolineaceae bacterium]
MLLDSLDAVESHYQEITKLIEENINNYHRIAELSKEKSDLEEIVAKSRVYRQTIKSIQEAQEIISASDNELSELAKDDLEHLLPLSKKLEKELKALLVPKDPRDKKNVIIEIRAGTGGDEAGLFAADLFRMYSRYADKNKWSIEVISQNDTGIGGFKEIIFMVKGRGAYSRFKFESGVHRVQRIPTTESSGRIHTSTVTVAVLAEVEDVDIQIPDTDLKIDVYKSAGAGGQNVQKNSTAIRITHLPTGIVVACQDERSQLQNKLRAMSIMRAKLYDIEVQKQQAKETAARRAQVGTGGRSEKIRTYNYPQSRVTDHRINISSHNLSSVMEGEIDLFIDELTIREETDRLSAIEPED